MVSVGSSGDGGDDQDLVTVAIPARDEEVFIGRCLDSILAQDMPNLQVLVVDGGSTDRTAEIVESRARTDPRIELLHNSERIIPVSLNMALRAARGRWFVRVDAHATVPPDYVRRAVRHLATGEWGGVGGRKDGVGVTPAGRAIAVAMASRFGVGNSVYHYGSAPQVVEHIPFGAYPTALAGRLGGWDERLLVNQDFEFDVRVRRAGYRLLFDPGLVIHWHCRQSVGALFQQYRRYGRGKVFVALLHPGSIRLRQLAGSALVASWVGAALLAVRWRRLAMALVLPYPAALVVASVVCARRLDDRRARPWVPAAFAAMHTGWGIGMWTGVGRVASAVLSGRPERLRWPAGPPSRPITTAGPAHRSSSE